LPDGPCSLHEQMLVKKNCTDTNVRAVTGASM
jgi:hypothetical protein